MLVLNLPAFKSKKYAAYDCFHGNGPYGEIPTEKGPIRAHRFALPYNNEEYSPHAERTRQHTFVMIMVFILNLKMSIDNIKISLSLCLVVRGRHVRLGGVMSWGRHDQFPYRFIPSTHFKNICDSYRLTRSN